MLADQSLNRVRLGALALMIALGAETIRYLVTSLDRSLSFAFLKPEMWNQHHLVDPGTVIGMGPRIGYFAIWGGIIALSLACFLLGLALLNAVRRGQIFHERSAGIMRRLGLLLSFTMVADLSFHAADAWLLTRMNTAPLPIQWSYDPSDIKTLILALILFLFGCVMQRGIEIERENSEYV